jgi:CD109 antigen
MVDGTARFQIEPAGSLPQGGDGGISLEVQVTDTAGQGESARQFVRITDAPFILNIESKSASAKPGFGLEFTVQTMDPTGIPISLPVNVTLYANDGEGQLLARLNRSVMTQGGTAELAFPIPYQAEYLVLEGLASDGPYQARTRIYGPVAYSPNQSYIKIERTGAGPVALGESIQFHLLSNQTGETFYEVLSGGRTVCSGTAEEQIQIPAIPAMAPESRLLVYRIFPDSEVGVDSYNFQVEPPEDSSLRVEFDRTEAAPGEPVKIQISADSQSMLGLAIVDESVFHAGNQGRLDFSRVYREIVTRFGAPSEEELQNDFADRPHTIGALDILSDAGRAVVVSPGAGSHPALLIPRGYTFWPGDYATQGTYSLPRLEAAESGLAEVERVREYFPETWVWNPTLETDPAGHATLELTCPDSITNWKLRALSTSWNGLGFTQGDLVVFQDFFVEPDLPYAVTRNEEMWLPVAVYNYLDSTQSVLLELEPTGGFEILGEPAVTVDVEPNSVQGARFPIRATGLGTFPFQITARGQAKADAVIRTLRVEPEGTPREVVLNEVIDAGEKLRLDASFPAEIVPGSNRLLLTITGSQVAQTINGVEDLCGKPYG